MTSYHPGSFLKKVILHLLRCITNKVIPFRKINHRELFETQPRICQGKFHLVKGKGFFEEFGLQRGLHTICGRIPKFRISNYWRMRRGLDFVKMRFLKMRNFHWVGSSSHTNNIHQEIPALALGQEGGRASLDDPEGAMIRKTQKRKSQKENSMLYDTYTLFILKLRFMPTFLIIKHLMQRTRMNQCLDPRFK